MIKFLRNYFRAKQREIDLRILWPSIRARAPDILSARQAFFSHIVFDPAWGDFTLGDLVDLVNDLT